MIIGNKHKTIERLTGACLILLLLTVTVWSLDGCSRAGENKEKGKPPAAQNAGELTDRKEKLSYALGMVLGDQFRDQSVEIDPDLYVQGLKDALAGGKTLLTKKEARAAVNEFQRGLKHKRPAQPAAAELSEIKVSFKLDPRLTKSMYMGDRWVSVPIFTSTLQTGEALTVAAHAEGVDVNGRPVLISPEWMPADPDMVTVTPGKGGTVKITVKGAGQSSLKVTALGVTKELEIKAMDRGDAMQVEIAQ